MSTNSLGLRGPEIDSPKKHLRVLCLGDSVTFGWGVEEQNAYPALLQQKIMAEVINAGVPGVPTDRPPITASKNFFGSPFVF